MDKQRFAFKLNYDIAPEMKRDESVKTCHNSISFL